MQDPQAQLAKMYVEEFLRDKGLTAESLADLLAERTRQIMVEASTYAALKLAEVENKSQLTYELDGVSQSD